MFRPTVFKTKKAMSLKGSPDTRKEAGPNWDVLECKTCGLPRLKFANVKCLSNFKTGHMPKRTFYFIHLFMVALRLRCRPGTFSSGGARALHCSGAPAQWLWHMGLVALQHWGSSQIRDRTHVPCTSGLILNHQTTREALK